MDRSSTPEPDLSVLEPWAAFPVAASPRPTVLLAAPVRIGPGGFVDGDSKIAYLNGAIRSDVPLPDGLLALLTGARRAQVGMPQPPPLVVSAIEATTFDFTTDRGPTPLSAYRVQVVGMREPCHILDPSVEVWWPRESTTEPRRGSLKAQLETDGMTLHVAVYGGVLTMFEDVRFVERETVVMALPVTREETRPPGTTISLVAIGGTVTGRLAEPLGARVLVNSAGTPYEVLGG